MVRGHTSLSEKLRILADTQLRSWGSSPRQFNYDPQEILEMAGTFDNRIKVIEESREYNHLGKDNRKNEVVIETYGQVSKWGEKMFSGLDGRIESMRDSIRNLTKPPGPKDSTEAILFELRQMEIRKAFSSTDALEAELLFLNSSPEIRNALINGPPVVRRTPDGGIVAEAFVRGELIDRIMMGEAEAAAGPEKVAEIRELSELRAKFESLLTMFQAELKKQTNVVLAEPVAMKG
mgnify:CR=1 FL=1